MKDLFLQYNAVVGHAFKIIIRLRAKIMQGEFIKDFRVSERKVGIFI